MDILDVLTWVELDFVSNEDYEVTETELYRICPPGWHSLLATALSFRSDMAWTCEMRGLRTEKGLLRIVGHCSNLNEQEVWSRLAQSLAASSALVCMVCGVKGFRRKMYAGKPCLCTKHYIEYANALGGEHVKAREQEGG